MASEQQGVADERLEEGSTPPAPPHQAPTVSRCQRLPAPPAHRPRLLLVAGWIHAPRAADGSSAWPYPASRLLHYRRVGTPFLPKSWSSALDPWLSSTSHSTTYNGMLRSSSRVGERTHAVASRGDQSAVALRRWGPFCKIYGLQTAQNAPLYIALIATAKGNGGRGFLFLLFF